MADGVYTINYTGKHGFGSAALILLKGQIFGTDVAGAEYTGTFKIHEGRITGEINLTVPAGGILVTGAAVSAQPYTVSFPFSMPAEIQEKQVAQVQVQLPSGAVNANIKKLKTLAA